MSWKIKFASRSQRSHSLNGQEVTHGVPSRITPAKRPKAAILGQRIFRWYRRSVLRRSLREICSCYHRFLLTQRISGTLRFDEVRRSLPQVSCSDSRNGMQFCTASIRSLEEARPWLSMSDVELFCQGWLLAERWYDHLDMQRRKSEQSSKSTSHDGAMLAADSNSATDQT